MSATAATTSKPRRSRIRTRHTEAEIESAALYRPMTLGIVTAETLAYGFELLRLREDEDDTADDEVCQDLEVTSICFYDQKSRQMRILK